MGERRLYQLLLGALLLSYAYFYQAGGWNQNSRFDVMRAVVEHGTLCIDAYHTNTFDKAHVGEHYYGDKAPGQSLLGVPAVAAARVALWGGGVDPKASVGIAAQSYAATIFTSALPAVGAAACLLWLALAFGAGRGGAIFAAVAFGLSTPMWAYATLLWGHALGASLLVIAFAAATALGRVDDDRRAGLLGLAVGLAAGWATISEYPCAPPAAFLAVLALVQAWPGGRARRWRVAAAITVGAGVCIAVWVAYQLASFGSITTLGYSKVEGFTKMQDGFMGVTHPRLGILRRILVGRFRGLLRLAPVLALAPVGFALLLRQRASRAPAACALAIVVYYLLFNSAYAYWDGGWSYGPRFLAGALPFAALALAPLWPWVTGRLRTPWRTLLLALVLYGAVMALVAVSTTPMPSDKYKSAWGELWWPAFRDQQLALNRQSFLESHPDEPTGRDSAPDAWNVGQLLGLEGWASLAPLLLGWLVLGGAGLVTWSRRGRSTGRSGRPGSSSAGPTGRPRRANPAS